MRTRLLLVVRLFLLLLSGVGLLGGLPLLLVLLVALGAGRFGQRLLEDLEDFFILDLLVRLDLGQVDRLRSSQLGDAVLGDGWQFS